MGFNAERVQEFGGLIERYGRDIAAAEEKLAVQQSQIEHNDQELAEITEALKLQSGELHAVAVPVKIIAQHGYRFIQNGIGHIHPNRTGARQADES